jgi:phosphoglycolate phosphatase-like HAD superfamily hydrolase
VKLKRAGLATYFAPGPGAFGSDSEDRAALPHIARRRADHAPRERTMVIGDTPRDIACAQADGLRCIAVASGPYSAEELQDADFVAGDARELQSILAEQLSS